MEITDEQNEKVEDVMGKLSSEFNFDIYGKDDISQEVFIICMELISDYTEDKGELFPFLLGAARNKLISLIRSKYGSSHNKNYSDRMAIINTAEINGDDHLREEELSLVDKYSDYIRENIAPEFKEDFLRIKEGIKIPHTKKYEVISYIKNCMNIVDEKNG